MFRFTLRELLWVTLSLAALLAWRLEANQASQWQERAEQAMSQLETQTLGQMAFQPADTSFSPSFSPSYDPPLREVPGASRLSPGTALLNAAFAWLP